MPAYSENRQNQKNRKMSQCPAAPRPRSTGQRCALVFLVLALLLAAATASTSEAKVGAAPRVSTKATMDSSGLLSLSGHVRPSRPQWRVRIQARTVQVKSGRGRVIWVKRGASTRLGRGGRFALVASARERSLTVRAAVLSGRRLVAVGRSMTAVRPEPRATLPVPGAPDVSTPPPSEPRAPKPAQPPPQASSTLGPGKALAPDERLLSPNKQYSLVMQASDGNLVLYRDRTPLWAAGPAGAGASAVMQTDGNLVVYRATAPQWASNTGFAGATLQLQDDGNLVIYHMGRGVWASQSGYLGDRLNAGAALVPGAYLRSADGRYTLVMQPEDGNLALYGRGGAIWAWGTAGNPGAHAVMQTDGNFVLYKGSTPVKATNTAGRGAYLKLQEDANIVVYQGSTPLWSRYAAQGPVQIINGSIADQAERRSGYYGQECLRFVSDMIAASGGPRYWFPGDPSTYNAQWASKATRIASLEEAERGDIIQWTGGRSPHTAIVTASGANPSVIDSNVPAGSLAVSRGTFASRNSVGGTWMIWRVGQVPS